MHPADVMPQMLADRFVASGARWIDLATGDVVRLYVAPAGSAIVPVMVPRSPWAKTVRARRKKNATTVIERIGFTLG